MTSPLKYQDGVEEPDPAFWSAVIAVALVAILEVLVAMFVVFVLMLDVLVAMFVVFVLMLDVLAAMSVSLDSVNPRTIPTTVLSD